MSHRAKRPQSSSDAATHETASRRAYAEIVKSSAIIGGAQGAEIVIRMIRTKLIAVLLGPSGVGLAALYQSTVDMVGRVAGLGIRSSGVRQVAEANARGDAIRVAIVAITLWRVSWIAGTLGWLVAAVFATPLSMLTFGDDSHKWPIALLGVCLVLENIAAGQSALMQGVRNIRGLAMLQLSSALAGTVVACGIYWWLGVNGIVPALILNACVNVAISWGLSKNITLSSVRVTWNQSLREARSLIALGLSFMWSGLAAACAALIIRAQVVRLHGSEGNGLYQAAWGISGMLAGFVLTALGKDFYPRLTAVASHNGDVNRLVNQQAQIALLLALPGLLATTVFAPWGVSLFYSSEFSDAVAMLPWFCLGVYGQVISWPVGYILLAKGAGRTFVATELIFHVLHLCLVSVGIRLYGLVGGAAAFALAYLSHIMVVRFAAYRHTGFAWSGGTFRMFVDSSLLFGSAFASAFLSLPRYLALGIGAILTISGSFYSARNLYRLLGPEHRLSRMLSMIPLVGKA